MGRIQLHGIWLCDTEQIFLMASCIPWLLVVIMAIYYTHLAVFPVSVCVLQCSLYCTERDNIWLLISIQLRIYILNWREQMSNF